MGCSLLSGSVVWPHNGFWASPVAGWYSSMSYLLYVVVSFGMPHFYMRELLLFSVLLVGSVVTCL